MIFDFKIGSNSIDSRLFCSFYLLWWITLPIGSELLSFDFGPFVLYPNLFFTLVICFFGIGDVWKWSKLSLIATIFLVLWLIQGSIQLVNLPIKSSLAIFDFRSLIVQLLSAIVLFTSFYKLGREKFIEITVLGVRYFVLILLISGIFEAMTGIHLSGHSTAKLKELHVSSVHFAPMYFFDNPNDFVANLLFYIVLLILFDNKWSKNIFLMIALLIITYYFSDLADSRFGKIAAVILLTYYLLLVLKDASKHILYLVGASLIVTMSVFIANPLYLGSKYDKETNYRTNGLVSVDKQLDGSFTITEVKDRFTINERNTINDLLDSLENNKSGKSGSIRKSIILNGIEFIKEKPILGVGPGQFYQRHIDGKVQHDSGTVTSAHCMPIEAIATYGLVGWVYFIFLVIILFKLFKRRSSTEEFAKQMLVGLIICILWLMPSNFIYLEIHRLLLPLLVILVSLKVKSEHVS